jgi:predicted outer membrane protein
MRPRATPIAAAAALLAAALPAVAQPRHEPLPAPAYGVPWQRVNRADRQFVQQALLAIYFAIDLGRLGERNGSTLAERQTAAEQVRDGQSRTAALAALAARKGIKPPRGLDSADIATLDRLTGLRAAAFDGAYRAAASRNRRDEAAACEREVAFGGDPELLEFARRRLAQLTAGRGPRGAIGPAR